MVNKVNNSNQHFDVIVVGAGLIGLAAVIALSVQGKHVALVDAKPKPKLNKLNKVWDSRIYALTPSTERWLDQQRVWSLIDQSRIQYVEGMALWSPKSESPLHLHASDANLSNLACIIENQNLILALWQQVEALNIPILMDSTCQRIAYKDDQVVVEFDKGCQITAQLLVAADGANSSVRQALGMTTNAKDFNQTALVANYRIENRHNNVAMQWFKPHETLALLPMPDKYMAMVWAMSTDKVQKLLTLTKEELAESVRLASNNVAGCLVPVSDTSSFLLRQVTVTKQTGERIVFVGDAAHQVHPMAGQGANLGFRDIIELESLIKSSHPLQDIGDAFFLRQYARIRKADIIRMNTLTSGLDTMFAFESKALAKLVSLGMQQLDKYATIKRVLINQAVA
jgi:ubiquinone biosynthesis UbiH/UbiF/VisC/COQ6 family hydroxylase